jgi:hypothetical protein
MSTRIVEDGCFAAHARSAAACSNICLAVLPRERYLASFVTRPRLLRKQVRMAELAAVRGELAVAAEAGGFEQLKGPVAVSLCVYPAVIAGQQPELS